jgi:dienelactone hydrolase
MARKPRLRGAGTGTSRAGAAGGRYLEDQGGCKDAEYSRSGRAGDAANQACVPHRLQAAAEFGRRAEVPVTWLVAANDSCFPPDLSRQMADAFRRGGNKMDFRVLLASGSEGRWLVETDVGITSAGPELERALKARAATAAKPR